MKRMKRWVSVLLAMSMMFMLLPTTVLAANSVASGTCGESLTWVLDSEGTLTISGTGEMEDYNSLDTNTAPWDRSKVKNVVVEDTVTSIGKNAFTFCNNLKTVSLRMMLDIVDSMIAIFLHLPLLPT